MRLFSFIAAAFLLLPGKKLFVILFLLLKKAMFFKIIFRRGAAVAQLTVNQLVVGSNPTVGASLEN